jgi:hypothetical protein
MTVVGRCQQHGFAADNLKDYLAGEELLNLTFGFFIMKRNWNTCARKSVRKGAH